MRIEFESELWVWQAATKGSWTFVSLPPELGADIRELADGPRRGFGAVRVRVRLGASEWRTSIFPSAEQGTYVLPVKKSVRDAEGLAVGEVATVRIELVDL